MLEREHKPPTSPFLEKAAVYFDFFLIGLVLVTFGLYFLTRNIQIEYVLGVAAVIGLVPVVASTVRALIKKELTIDLLASVALISSLLAAEWVPAAFITLMLSFARLFDHWTEAKTKAIITHLLKYKPRKVKVRRGEGVIELPLSHVRLGDLVMVESGDRVPVDGIVLSGSAAINEASLTGESELVPKKKGDKVLTSTLNESGSLIVRADKIGADTTLEKIIALVEGASRKRAKSERLAAKFTKWYIIITIAAAIVMYLAGLSNLMILSVLLVVCADDIAVAVPLGFTAAIAHAARRGVVIKGSAALEKLGKIKYVITDKTGTLTEGRPKVTSCKAFGQYTEKEILKRFSVGASASHHAVSKAILDAAAADGLEVHAPDQFEETPGEGISFIHDGEKCVSGRPSFLKKRGIVLPSSMEAEIEKEKDNGFGVAALSINGKAAGLISYRDEIRSNAKRAIEDTRKLGVKSWHMLTGDNEHVAKKVGEELGLNDWESNITPEGKLVFVEGFKKEQRGVVAMIGDGVNDAASLALADVSIAMGAGTDTAIEAADISLVHDNLERIPEAISIAKRSIRIMRENFGVWVLTNALGLSLVFLGILGPAGAATYNFLTDFLPILNALRLFGGQRSLATKKK